MPNISNATVATGTGLSTAGNGGRKLVRLSNGWIIAAVHNGIDRIMAYVSKDNGATFALLCKMGVTGSSASFAISSKGSMVYVLVSYSGNTALRLNTFNAETVTMGQDLGDQITYVKTVDSGQSAYSGLSLAINDAGTELYAAWSSKNATYPNSFNIRYAKGTIAIDGSVTWGAVEQVTTLNTSGSNRHNPSVQIKADGKPIVLMERIDGTFYEIYRAVYTTSWSLGTVYNGGSYAQSSPSAIFVPQSINGLANGRMWVAWHGRDATDSAQFNVRVSYSDDGGVTWATPVKLTSGNLYDRQNVSLAADKTGKVFALYEEHQWSPDLDIYMRTFSGGSWGAPVAVAEADPAAESNPSALVDYSLMMTTPPFVFMSGTDGIKFSGNFNVGASVSPVSGSLGSKETPTITAYTVTPENGSTVTQIVEKLNGVTLNTYNNPASLSRTFTVPQVNWDGIMFWYSHTAEIIVTDSNGAVTTTTYTFVKALADNAPLLEGVAATEDAYERISDKRDALAAQVGLSAGSTFDAISAQLASGAVFKKFQSGVSTVSANKITVNSLSFEPKQIIVFGYISGTTYDNMSAFAYDKDNIARNIRSGSNDVITPTANGFTVTATRVNVGTYGWLAFG